MSSSDQNNKENDVTRRQQQTSSSRSTNDLPTDSENETSDAFADAPATSSSAPILTGNLLASNSTSCDRMKRTAARKLIERYFYQLTDGCGNANCSNEYCASNCESKVKNLTPNQAAAQAIKLFSREAKLCDRAPSKVARTDSASGSVSDGQSTSHSLDVNNIAKDAEMWSVAAAKSADADSNELKLNWFTSDLLLKSPTKNVEPVTCDQLEQLLDTFEQNNCVVPLQQTLREVFSCLDVLTRSFRKKPTPSDSALIDKILDKTEEELSSLKKEDVCAMLGESEKDEDSSCSSSKDVAMPTGKTRESIDIAAVTKTFKRIMQSKVVMWIEDTMLNAITAITTYMTFLLQSNSKSTYLDDIVDALLILTALPLDSGEYLSVSLPAIASTINQLPVEAQAKLAQRWAAEGTETITFILHMIQQLITLRVIMSPFHADYLVQDEPVITSSTKFMKIVYYASIMGGKLDSVDLRHEDPIETTKEDDSLFRSYWHKHPSRNVYKDPLAKALGVEILDCRKPLVPFEMFYNESLSEVVEMDRDFSNYKEDASGASEKFSFMKYSFILTPSTKTMGLYFDSRIRMYSERRISLLQTMTGAPSTPYLKLKVRRDHIIEDALVELELIAMDNPVDLKKQLVVEFTGEQGVDEGGISKEFFQLIIEELFNPDYGMFMQQTDSHTVWFNSNSFETDAQFTLVGIVLGLAIYNNVILSVNFPKVVYSKLMGKKGSFDDLEDWSPVLYRSLKDLLEYEGDDMEEVFMQTFSVSQKNVFGATTVYQLKENAEQTFVTQLNKREFVDLYADFLLNKSIENQYRAFYRGFKMVTDESPLGLLFRPEEIELLVCGSKNFDLHELEDSTSYDGGYTKNTTIIQDFWSIVHEVFTLDDQRKLLQFATGSDRIPVGGFSKLRLVISRNGSDSDRLPTAHTCFNVLLLPEYASKEKLQDRLLKAINYSKGFGMM